MQIKQFAQLEQAIEVQKHVQHEQQKEVQQQLNNTLEKHQLDFIQLIEAVQNRSCTRLSGSLTGLTSTSVNGSVESVTPSSSLTFSSSISVQLECCWKI
jgi:hypothetical protein